MKKFKKVIIVFLTIILVNLVSVLGFSISLKDLLVNGIIKETVKSTIINRDYGEGNYVSEITSDDIINNPNLSSEESNTLLLNKDIINKLLEDEKVMELVDGYIDKTINAVVNGKEIDDIDIESDMINYIDENRETIQEATGVEITDETIQELRENYEDKHITRMYINSIESMNKSFSKTEKTVLNGYNFLISSKFKLIIIGLIILNLLFIALLKKSFYKWIKNLGYSFSIGGFGLVFIGIIISYILKSIVGLSTINTMSLINIGLIFGVFGLLVFVVYLIIVKNIMNRDDGNVIS